MVVQRVVHPPAARDLPQLGSKIVGAGLTVWVAPSRRASSSRESWTSMPMTVVHDAAAATINAAKPTAPVPKRRSRIRFGTHR